MSRSSRSFLAACQAVVVEPGAQMMYFIGQIYRSPNWALVYLDGTFLIFLKNLPAFSTAIQNHRIDFKKGYEPPRTDLKGAWRAEEDKRIAHSLFAMQEYELAAREFKAAYQADCNNHCEPLGQTQTSPSAIILRYPISLKLQRTKSYGGQEATEDK